MNGTLCKYAPIEIFAGFSRPAELIRPTETNYEAADGHLHPNVCSFAKAAYQATLSGGYDTVLFTDCCDAMKRACDALSAAASTRTYMLSLPRGNGPAAIQLYTQALLRFVEELECRFGTPFDTDAFLSACAPAVSGPSAPYIGVVGARTPPGLLEAAERLCTLPVADLTCGNQQRAFSSPPTGAAREEVLHWYAGQLLAQTPCMRMPDTTERSALFEDENLRGIIYHTIKFCDYYGFEFASLGTPLPALKLETDFTPTAAGQLKTRLQAFFEAQNILKREAPAMRKSTGQCYAGIDIGSTSTNVVVVNGRGEIMQTVVLPTGAKSSDAAGAAMEQALAGAGIGFGDIGKIVATGYGRGSTPFAADDITEISCHARGVTHLFPGARTIIDIGGQDSKVIRLDKDGQIVDFSMNDKCAAGTGRFLELMADTLKSDLSGISALGQEWNEDISISSMCAVFAESEVISLIAENKDIRDIVRGINLSIAGRVSGMAARLNAKGPYVMTGGVAKNSGVHLALEEKVGSKIQRPADPQLCGALGAALYAAENPVG